MDYFSYVRAQTSIDSSGVAKEHSLRFLRVLRKNLIFNFNIKFDKKNLHVFKRICKITRKFGTRRTRGFGQINVWIDENEGLPIQDEQNKKSILIEKLQSFKEDEICKLTLKLKNKEQILVSNQIGSHDNSEYFIPGSTILGTLAGKYISLNQERDSIHEDNIFFDLFISDDTKFSNFYPIKGELEFYPAPLFVAKEKYFDNYYDLTISQRPEGIDLVNLPPLVSLKENIQNRDLLEIYTPNFSKSVQYHHARPRNDRTIGHATEDFGDFYQYEVIEPGQTFQGSIIGSAKNLQHIIKLFDSDEFELTIGKSRTAQYGKCILKLDDIKIIKETISLINTNRLIITLISDMILVNDYGFISPDIDLFLEEFMNVLDIPLEQRNRVNIEKRYLKYKKVGGFKDVWKLPKKQAQALASGSELVVKFDDNFDIKKYDINKVRKHFFGTRKSEGYGQIRINWHNHKKVIEKQIKMKFEEVPKNLARINDYIQFCIIERLKFILKQEAHKRVNKKDLKELKRFSKSFIYRIKNIIDNAESINSLKDLFTTFTNREKKKAIIDGLEHSIPLKFRDNFRAISDFIMFDSRKNIFKAFENLLKYSSTILEQKDYREYIFPKIKEKVPMDFYKSYQLQLYQIFSNTLLKDMLFRLK